MLTPFLSHLLPSPSCYHHIGARREGMRAAGWDRESGGQQAGRQGGRAGLVQGRSKVSGVVPVGRVARVSEQVRVGALGVEESKRVSYVCVRIWLTSSSFASFSTSSFIFSVLDLCIPPSHSFSVTSRCTSEPGNGTGESQDR